MEITVSASENINGTLILPLFEGSDGVPEKCQAGMSSSMKNQINRVLSDGDFKAKKKSTMSLYGGEDGKAILVGLGKADESTIHDYRNAGATVTAAIKKSHGNEMTVRFDGAGIPHMAAFAEGLMLRDYSYDNYKKSDDGEDKVEVSIRITCSEKEEEELVGKVNTFKGVCKGVHLSRDLGNCPPNDMYPEVFADMAREWAKDFDNVDVTIINYDEAVKAGMGGLVAVGMGSSRKPCMVIFEMNKDVKGRCPVLVGKGITFDTGGISLKPGANMDEMKYDMSGAASVLGTMEAIALIKPKSNIIGVVASAENMPGSKATKPGDVVKTMSGQTVEILNTDAEGRLVLCDALTYVERFKPKNVIDIATLTGAVIVALGHVASGLMSNNQKLADKIIDAGHASMDKAWQLPLWDEYQGDLDSNFADIANIGGRAGTITAACFLSRFTKKYPWAHLDVAGTAHGSGKAKASRGRPVPLLTNYLLSQS